eukprot:GGOE01045630.1.p1 GENE.GGOE01045630.1~~GGOE01045630.1.p1  ORF type:complete len:454 (-),score=75.53 GGOE01045630.1:330-1658(-)
MGDPGSAPAQSATSGGPAGVADIPAFLLSLSDDDLRRFSAVYEIREEIGTCVIPPTLQAKVCQWFARPGEELPAVLHRVARQPVVAVFNRQTCEEARCNGLRTGRPQTIRADAAASAEAALEALYAATDSRDACDFCAWEERTVADVWGRVVSPLGCATAANMGKVGAHHGMVLLPAHHPIRSLVHPQSGATLLCDILATAHEWCQRSIRHQCAQREPPEPPHGAAATGPLSAPGTTAWHSLLFWNAGLGSGASQPHGHVQLLVRPGHAPGRAETQLRAAAAHWEETGRDYLDDVLWCHQQLRLAVPVAVPSSVEGEASTMAAAFVVVPLTPLASHELWAVGRTLRDVAHALHVITRVLREHFHARCFNVGCLLPGSDGPDGSSEWILARVMDRTSQPTSTGSLYGIGIGAGELYGAVVEDSDLYATRDAVLRIVAQSCSTL